VGADGDWIRIHQVEKEKKKKKRKKKENKCMIHGIRCGLDMTRRIGCFIYLFIFTSVNVFIQKIGF
jgi:hypothetical protein